GLRVPAAAADALREVGAGAVPLLELGVGGAARLPQPGLGSLALDGPRQLGHRLLRLVPPRQRPAPAGPQQEVVRLGGDEAVEVEQGGEPVLLTLVARGLLAVPAGQALLVLLLPRRHGLGARAGVLPQPHRLAAGHRQAVAPREKGQAREL